MKNFTLLFLFIIFLLGSSEITAQKKSRPTGRKIRSIVKPAPKPKIETEDWKEFDAKDLAIKVVFPKTPTVTKSEYAEFEEVDVKSSTLQSYVNGVFYMVEAREYPKNFLPDRYDLGADYGSWLKQYILFRNKILSEKTFSFELYKIVEFTYQQMSNDVVIHRAVVIGDNLYQLIVQIEIKKPDNLEQTIEKNKEKIGRFFDSFVITNISELDSTIS